MSEEDLAYAITGLQQGCAAFIVTAMLVAVTPSIVRTLDSVIHEQEKRRAQPTLRITPYLIVVEGSANLAGLNPLEGLDYNRDGRLDAVMRLVHGGGRIPYFTWEALQETDLLYQQMQNEYAIALKNTSPGTVK